MCIMEVYAFINFLNYSNCTELSSSVQVLDRGEKIELLVDKTENLHSQVGGISLLRRV